MADPLSITSDLEYDEGIGAQSDDSDVSSLSSALQDAIDALVSLNFLPSPPSGFPQYAEVTDFFTSGSPVTDIKLASDANGSAFSQSTGVATDLYYGSYQVSLYATDDENVVVGRVGGASGSIVLVIALNDDLSGDPSLGVAVYAPLVHGDGSAVDDADTLNLAGKVYLYDTFSTLSVVPFNDFSHVPSGQDAFALIASSDPNLSGVDLLTTGFAGSTAGTVNVSTTGLGANSQAVDNGSSLRIDIVSANAADLAKADTSTEVHNTSNISYQNHVDAIAAGFQLTQNNPTNKLAEPHHFCLPGKRGLAGVELRLQCVFQRHTGQDRPEPGRHYRRQRERRHEQLRRQHHPIRRRHERPDHGTAAPLPRRFHGRRQFRSLHRHQHDDRRD